MTKLISSVCILLTSVLTLSACSHKRTESAPRTDSSTVKAPDFEVTTIAGKKISLQSSLKEGKPMVVYFTASWCPKCAKNWPELSKVYPEYKGKLTLVAISIDPSDTEEVIKVLAGEKGFTFPVTAGHPEIMLDFGVENQATTVGINRDGQIAFQKSYTTLTANEFRTLFDTLID